MAATVAGDSSHHHGIYDKKQHLAVETGDEGGWYYSRTEIEEDSPSRRDGIDLKKEAYLRKSYCTFLQDLGMRLKVPQVTIATAIIFCHRFFLRQSHAKNDRRTIATVCMFLAGKVEETPRLMKDVIIVSYEIIHKKDAAAVQRIKQKEVYEQQKELIVLGERVVLATLGFDFNVHHPYKPLVEAIKKFKVAQNALAQVAWNFVNDGLRTSLCLQFKPHHIAAGAIFLAAKFLKVKLPSDGEKVWWQEFDVTPRQLEEVSSQMLELYEQTRPSQASEAEGSTVETLRLPSKGPSPNNNEHINNGIVQGGGSSSRVGTSKSASSRPGLETTFADIREVRQRSPQSKTIDSENAEVYSISDGQEVNKIKEDQHHDHQSRYDQGRILKHGEEEGQGIAVRSDARDAEKLKDESHASQSSDKEGTHGQPPEEAIKKIDKVKVKAALEKRRKACGDVSLKTDLMDEDALIERELENGIELAAESEKTKHEVRRSWSKPPNRSEYENDLSMKHQDKAKDGQYLGIGGQPSHENCVDNVEEGEVERYDNTEGEYYSPKDNRKRKLGSPHDNSMGERQCYDHLVSVPHRNNHLEFPEQKYRAGKSSYPETDHKRHAQENHV